MKMRYYTKLTLLSFLVCILTKTSPGKITLIMFLKKFQNPFVLYISLVFTYLAKLNYHCITHWFIPSLHIATWYGRPPMLQI